MEIDLAMVRNALRARQGRFEDHPPGERLAAVAAVLRDGALGAELLIIQRAERTGDPWSGHMALPGGRRDPRDPDLLTTAMRETREEVGLNLAAHAALLGRLDDLPAVARGKPVGMTIAPFVFALERDVGLQTNHEVREALWVPLGPLYREELATTYRYPFGDSVLEMPAWDVDGRIVWGLTYRMVKELFRVIGASATRLL